MGYIDIERSPPAYTRSLSAAKMGTRAWPSTKTICRFKLDGGKRCRPRQFEYHPTEPSYMVFGTLQGEVVVINHESDKVVGYVQSSGAPHSILGLCWLNKDPNKVECSPLTCYNNLKLLKNISFLTKEFILCSL